MKSLLVGFVEINSLKYDERELVLWQQNTSMNLLSDLVVSQQNTSSNLLLDLVVCQQNTSLNLHSLHVMLRISIVIMTVHIWFQ